MNPKFKGYEMLKVLSVLGTRPEAIKMGPVINELALQSDRIINRVCVTAQHRQMLDQVLSLFGIEPDYDLDLMQDAQSSMQVAARALSKLETVLIKERPDWVLVQGDTTTAMAASIAAFYAGIRIGHVEAGLRTQDITQPFPEEGNRRIVSTVAELHFAPTEMARENLLRENIHKEKVLVTGNPIIDALYALGKLPCKLECGLIKDVPWEKSIILVTVHRRENFGRPLELICESLRDIAHCYRNHVHIIFPVHLNPNIWGPVHRLLSGMPGVTLVPPLDYLSFVHLFKRSYLVLTDSGGLQEEAPSLGKPVLVLRNTTERPEAVSAGTVRLVGTDPYKIVRTFAELWEDASVYHQMSRVFNLYGDGKSAERIVNALLGKKINEFCKSGRIGVKSQQID